MGRLSVASASFFSSRFLSTTFPGGGIGPQSQCMRWARTRAESDFDFIGVHHEVLAQQIREQVGKLAAVVRSMNGPRARRIYHFTAPPCFGPSTRACSLNSGAGAARTR